MKSDTSILLIELNVDVTIASHGHMCVNTGFEISGLYLPELLNTGSE